ncbi:alpha/beta fold hydrolase [Actinopolymorpha rutila]|uniref:Pimeloyl-ACP methyl ester carboxylesterase n=1 Tax=Actinopolymorpha rutila TaxID=446787 RepID=A0A852ZN85_9ACTN|nr:alpha/beta hydrolase [Actinopolymorpha rutila]NYH93012.1 pimeloyl-ACP methyl ester carboxylesterase [Actinopolymorpha rutila]
MSAHAGGAVEIDGPWTHRWVAANGARFHLAECGNGPLVLFLHGFPEFWWAWRHQLPALADLGYRAAAMDLRGYGGSDKTPRGYDPVTLAGDVAGLVRSLGHSDAVLVGHGWGGYVAWATATLHPRQVSSLAVVGAPHPLRLRREAFRGGSQLRSAGHVVSFQTPLLPERQLVADDGALVERLLRRWSAPGSAFPDPEAARRYRTAMQLWPAPHCALEYYRWLVRAAFRSDGRRFVARMKQPVTQRVLQVHGMLDPSVLPATAEGSAEYVAGTHRWRLLDGVGHFPHEEAPDAFLKELLAWLDDA